MGDADQATRTHEVADVDRRDQVDGVTPPVDDVERGGPADRWVIAGWIVAVALALVPAVRMVGIVLDGSALQYNDYWMMVSRFLNPDGSLAIGGLFEFQNEHPLVVPQFAYWCNVRLFAGSNTTLGLFVVGLVLAQLAVVVAMLRRSAFRPIEQMALLVLASALLFDLAGTWNFAKAMSGTAWLMANLFVLVAVYLRSRDRQWPALAVAVLAAASYGTGIMVWPALIATGCSRRPFRQWWREWPAAVGFVAAAVWYRSAGHSNSAIGAAGVVDILRVTAELMGEIFGLADGAAQLVGLVPLIGVPVLAIFLALRSDERGVGAWIGVATFGLLASLVITSGRAQYWQVFRDQSRYTSLPALTWIGFAALVLVALRTAGAWLARHERTRPARVLASPALAVVLLVPLVLAAATAGREHADLMLESAGDQTMREVGLRLRLPGAEDHTFGVGFATPDPFLDRLVETGHHPFVPGWDLDCGLLRRPLEGADGDGDAGVGAVTGGDGVFGLRGAVEVDGYVEGGRTVRCVVITGASGEVVGAAGFAGVAGIEGVDDDHPGRVGFRGLAAAARGERFQAHVIYEGDPDPHTLAGTFTAG